MDFAESVHVKVLRCLTDVQRLKILFIVKSLVFVAQFEFFYSIKAGDLSSLHYLTHAHV